MGPIGNATCFGIRPKAAQKLHRNPNSQYDPCAQREDFEKDNENQNDIDARFGV
jgi:hypothetical protein